MSTEQALIEVQEVTCVKNRFPVYLLLISGAILNLWDHLGNVFLFWGCSNGVYDVFTLLFIQELVSNVPIKKVKFYYSFS